MAGTIEPERGESAEAARLSAEVDYLRAEIARMADRARASDASARLQAARLSSILDWAARNETALRELYDSTFWRVTAPLRLAARLIGGAPPSGAAAGRGRRVLSLAARVGWGAAWRKIFAVIRRDVSRTLRRVAGRLRRSGAVAEAAHAAYSTPLARPAVTALAPSVLIIAELSVPQCAKYRVWQKQEFLERLGIGCTVTDWHDLAASRAALQLCSLVIFYRVPGTAEMLDLIAEARRLGVTSWWEVDDLIFEEAVYRANRNLDTLTPETRENLMLGGRLYRRSMLACDKAIASTEHLAAAMRAAGVPEAAVVENALDCETLETAELLRATRLRGDAAEVRIIYGSGTKTHDIDFAIAAPALVRLMDARPEVCLRIVGDLALPPEMDRLAIRIERLERVDYRTWLALLADSDIALAPLENTVFNDAKSNIKFLEAAVLGVPAVCSPRANFTSVVAHGETGMLAEDAPAWFDALEGLADDPLLRHRMGEAAQRSVLARYAPDAVASYQLAPLVAGLDQRTKRGLRVLVANVFFWPRSFGGATIVAEETARRIDARDDAEVFVFTSHIRHSEQSVGLLRYEQDGMPIVSMAIPAHPDAIGEFDNPAVATQFLAVLRAVQPDVVHIHSIQGLGASILDACQEAGVPYVVTVHDAWWLCPRQFMVRGDGHYCFQTRIDLNLCRACVPEIRHLPERLEMLLRGLRGAALVLAPSESHRDLYRANGLDPARLLVQTNGIRLPARPRARRPGRVLRFGYVGGGEQVKGFPQLRRAFEGLTQPNWELVLVDNTLNLGFASIDVGDWRVAGRVMTEPAYAQDELDQFFERIDVLVFPSQWKESFGLTVREALARDVWVIATDCGGPAEAISDGVNGTLIPMDGRYEPLEAAIAALLDAPERLAGYRNPHKGRLATFDDQAEELFSLLTRAANQRRSRDSIRLTVGSTEPAAHRLSRVSSR
ncbi:MAG: glycosyltransferase [Alphaproteobacteria bacterium]|nr:glycosyltransferase [Alphaproteobacteria bacterium]